MSRCCDTKVSQYPKYLKDTRGMVSLGHWIQQLDPGFIVAQHQHWPPVGSHTSTSWHYVNQALDINWVWVKGSQFKSEKEALDFLYDKIKAGQKRHKLPVAEMFFDQRGYKDSHGWDVNVVVANHKTHLHLAMRQKRWR